MRGWKRTERKKKDKEEGKREKGRGAHGKKERREDGKGR